MSEQPIRSHEADDADVAEQSITLDDEPAESFPSDVGEADVADVAEQARPVPIREDDGPDDERR
jgi:hypothetical protein